MAVNTFNAAVLHPQLLGHRVILHPTVDVALEKDSI